MRNMILASVCAAAMLASGAASAQITGTLGGGYARVTDGGGADIYGLNGSLATVIANGWNFEGTGSYYNLNPGSQDLWSAGGNLFTATGFGRIAAGATHAGVATRHNTSWGAGADWFFSDIVTFSLKAGGHYASGIRNNGGYVGLQGAYYVTPDFALSASAEYASGSLFDTNNQKIKAEWKFSDTLPLSVYGGYQRFETAGADANTVFVGLKFYLDGAPNLVGSHRTGSLGYIGQSIFQIGAN